MESVKDEFGVVYSADGLKLLKCPDDIKISEYVIKQGAKVIADGAFYNCSSLTEVVIPEGIEKIGDGAFRECSSLFEIVIPEGVKKIGARAFSCCYKLSKIVIPNSVDAIGHGAFNACCMDIDNKSEAFQAENGILYNKDKSVVISVSRNDTEEVVLPEGIEEIGEDAFEFCDKLSKIVIPEGVKEIGAGAFSTCSSLSEIVFSEGVKKIGSYAFWRCSSLSEIVLPEGLEEIGAGAFRECSSLSEIVIPNSVEAIGSGAFNACCIDIDNKSEAFQAENGVLYNKDKSVVISVYRNDIEELVLPEGVELIGWDAFDGCDKLSSIYLSDIDKFKKIVGSRYSNKLKIKEYF